MKAQHIDTYIFVKGNFAQKNSMDVINELRNISGITSAQPHPKIKKLVEVSYNPYDTNCSHIVQAIKGSGYNSVWIGM